MSLVYWVVLLFILTFSVIAEKNPKTLWSRDGSVCVRPDPGIALILSVALVFVSGFRYYVGTDFGAYYQWVPSDWNKVWDAIIHLKEGGFSFLVKVARTIYDHPQSTIFAASAITVGIYCLMIYKYSAMYAVSMILYIFVGDWQGSFNGIRQYLAAAVLFAGHRYILSRNLFKYSIVVLIATSFHTTAIIMIVPYFLFTREADITQLVLLTVGSVVLRFSYGIIFSLISSYKGKALDVEGDSYLSNGVNIFRVLVTFIPVVIYIFLCRKEGHTKEQTLYINALFFNAFCMLAGMGSTYFGRVGIFTSAMTSIGFGHLLQLIDDDQSRRTTGYVVFVIYLFYWIYSLMAGGMTNFRFCFGQG